MHRGVLGWGWNLFSIVGWNISFEQSERPKIEPSFYSMSQNRVKNLPRDQRLRKTIFIGKTSFHDGIIENVEFRTLIRCETWTVLRTNAENKTISLNTRRGNQIHFLNHCGISLKGVLSWFVKGKAMSVFPLNSIKVINCHSNLNIKRFKRQFESLC